MIKKILKLIGVIALLVITGLLVYGFIIHESLPKGKSGVEADELAKKMLKALNYNAYQNTCYLEWSFRNGSVRYKWDKDLGECQVKWDDYIVALNLGTVEKSKVTKNNNDPSPKEYEKALEKAIGLFNNDSFWLVAPFKIFDKGATKKLIKLEDGSEALLVTYTKGGNTPGDSYLWLLNPNGFPNAYKMWVSIIPIGGIEASWDDWLVTESGAFLPKSHEFGPMTLSMGNVRGYNKNPEGLE